MEGLIPFLYKAIKDRRSRTFSRSLSSGTADRFDGEEQRRWLQPEAAVRSPVHGEVRQNYPIQQHRRHRSLEELAGEVGLSPERPLRQLSKARSVRIFSCIGAGPGAVAV